MSRKRLLDKNFEWDPELAYAMGLLVTDGNLSKDGRHVSLRSSDVQLLETFKNCLNLDNKILLAKKASSSWEKKPSYRIQFGNIQFYRWLMKIGLSPNKTHTIGEIDIPDKFLADFLRGHLDGDGSIRFYKDKYNTYRGRVYVNNRLYIQFISVSPTHIKWLQHKIKETFLLQGAVFKAKLDEKRGRKIPMWVLKFSKKESLKLIELLYYKENLPSLDRKEEIANLALNTIKREKRKRYSLIS